MLFSINWVTFMSVRSEITWWCETDVNTCALKIRLCIISRENNSVTRVQAGVLAYQPCSLVFNIPLGKFWLMPTICGVRWCLGRSGSSRTVCSAWNVELAAAWIRASWEGKFTSTFVFSAVCLLFLTLPKSSQMSAGSVISAHTLLSTAVASREAELQPRALP